MIQIKRVFLNVLVLVAVVACGLKLAQAREGFPWPLSLTCPVTAKHLDGWWTTTSGGVRRYFMFETFTQVDGGKTLVHFNQFTAAGNLVTHGSTVVGSRQSELAFDVFERSAPDFKRLVYVHQLADESSGCAQKIRKTMVSYVKLGDSSRRDMIQATYELTRSAPPNSGRKRP